MGVALLVAGMAIGRFEHAVIAGLLINLGTAIALVALLLAIEPRLLNSVRRTA